jgi:hypothetical protein
MWAAIPMLRTFSNGTVRGTITSLLLPVAFWN